MVLCYTLSTPKKVFTQPLLLKHVPTYPKRCFLAISNITRRKKMAKWKKFEIMFIQPIQILGKCALLPKMYISNIPKKMYIWNWNLWKIWPHNPIIRFNRSTKTLQNVTKHPKNLFTQLKSNLTPLNIIFAKNVPNLSKYIHSNMLT